MASELLENRYVNIGHAEYAAVWQTLNSRQLAGSAGVVLDYENALSTYFAGQTTVAMASGTAALHGLLIASGVGRGDEVILPPTAPVMSVLPIIAVGAIPVFADIGNRHLGLNISAVAEAISDKTRVILTVPMWGYPANSRELRNLADEQGILLIEDVSHCHGAIEDDQFMGTIGQASFFSTQERKLIATGEGGFILAQNKSLVDGLRSVRDFGKLQADLPGSPGTAGSYGYGFGLNFRISAISAALGIAQIASLDKRIQQRSTNAATIKEGIRSRGLPLVEWDIADRGRPNYYSLVLRSDSPDLDMRMLGRQLAAQNIISDLHRFGGTMLYELPEFAQYQRAECPNAEDTFKSIVTLPTHEGLSAEHLNHIVDTLSSAIAEQVN